MRAITDIIIALIFSYALGVGSIHIITKVIKKEAIIKIHGGLGSLENLTRQLTSKIQ